MTRVPLLVNTQYKGEPDTDGNKLADRLFAYLEVVAREHEDSTDEMPLHLVCDSRNERGLRFWESQQFVEIGRIDVPGDMTYVRMVRG